VRDPAIVYDVSGTHIRVISPEEGWGIVLCEFWSGYYLRYLSHPSPLAPLRQLLPPLLL